MIISITFRNGTDQKISRSRVIQGLAKLERKYPNINRVQVVFYIETHFRKYEGHVTCHISTHLAPNKPIEIYARQYSEAESLTVALMRTKSHIRRMTSKKYQQKTLDTEH